MLSSFYHNASSWWVLHVRVNRNGEQVFVSKPGHEHIFTAVSPIPVWVLIPLIAFNAWPTAEWFVYFNQWFQSEFVDSRSVHAWRKQSFHISKWSKRVKKSELEFGFLIFEKQKMNTLYRSVQRVNRSVAEVDTAFYHWLCRTYRPTHLRRLVAFHWDISHMQIDKSHCMDWPKRPWISVQRQRHRHIPPCCIRPSLYLIVVAWHKKKIIKKPAFDIVWIQKIVLWINGSGTNSI